GVNPDAPPGAGACGPDQPQCNNCIDDDGDGLVDGDDPECTGAIDNDEGSFSTGIPGDNIDTKHQDCFFDGNSGAGDDGCNIHTCCILGYDHQQCADAGIANNFDPATDCPAPTQECIDNCGALTPPGCDCFGCCTVCDGDGCADIYINPAIDPDCDQTTIHDPALCTVCTPSTVCGSDCGGDTCVLCPGQDPADLPPSCTTQECPNGAATCDLDHPCPSDTQFCSVGCCISVVQ
ncbi:MAG: hypothetical protein KC464_21835, partial [Myxococcales bacterium]|nr:hypothetical protein [Myxococcales bacterium]